jgi:hypothetical protein
MLSVCVSIFASCKSKQKAAVQPEPVATTTTSITETPQTIGKVSHKYRASGCETIVIVAVEGEETPLTLIPRVKLIKELDIDGLQISFNYHLLKMPQPAGCMQGIPAELSNIKKKLN